MSTSPQRREVFMLRKTLIALAVVSLGMALVSTDASARAGFRGGGFIASGSPEVGVAALAGAAPVGAADRLSITQASSAARARRPLLAIARRF
jgi:hypothetical protein